MYHTLVYNAAAAGVNAVNTDLVAPTDTVFTTRNNHYIFTDQIKLLAAAMVGASVTRGRMQSPTLNALTEFVLFNANRALQPLSNPQWDYYFPYPLNLPTNEEIQVQISNNLGAATEIENAVLQVATPGWTRNIPSQGVPYMLRLSTASITPTLNAWSGSQALTFSQAPRGGVWSVVGGVVQGSNAVAWRLIFPRQRAYNGRLWRPGGLTQNAIGDVVPQWPEFGWSVWGELGRFHTFEQPSIEVFGTAAVATVYQVFLIAYFLGGTERDLDAWASQQAS